MIKVPARSPPKTAPETPQNTVKRRAKRAQRRPKDPPKVAQNATRFNGHASWGTEAPQEPSKRPLEALWGWFSAFWAPVRGFSNILVKTRQTTQTKKPRYPRDSIATQRQGVLPTWIWGGILGGLARELRTSKKVYKFHRLWQTFLLFVFDFFLIILLNLLAMIFL